MEKVDYELWTDEHSLTLIEVDNRKEQEWVVNGMELKERRTIEFSDQEDLNIKLENIKENYLKKNWDDNSNTWKKDE